MKAWAYLDPALALAQAKAADAAKGGLLRGVPVGVKDIIDTHDMPTGHNSPIFDGKVPFGDAACVALCRTANAVILGKTVTTEFANRHPGPTTNPHNAGAYAGRFLVGLGRRGRRRPRAAGLRHADRRLGDPPRRLLRRDRLQADLRRLHPRRHQDAMPFGRHAGPDGAHPRRHRAVPRRRAQAAAGRDRPRASRAPRIGFCRTPIWDEASADTKALLEATARALADKGARWSMWRSLRAFADILDDHGAITGWEGCATTPTSGCAIPTR